jgi:hypothetical protein
MKTSKYVNPGYIIGFQKAASDIKNKREYCNIYQYATQEFYGYLDRFEGFTLNKKQPIKYKI